MRPRISNSGPELVLADIFGELGPWLVEQNTRSTAGTPNEYEAGVTTNPLLTQIVIPTPTATPPAGYHWGLRAEFTGNLEVLVPGDSSALLEHSLQVLTGTPGVWRGLSTTGSGELHTPLDETLVPVTGEYESINLHAVCPLDDLPVPAAATQTVRLAWSLSSGDEASMRYATGVENNTGGWDFTVKWIIAPD